MTFSKLWLKVEILFQLLKVQMQASQEDNECMHNFGFSNQNIYYFQKVFDLSEFSKF